MKKEAIDVFMEDVLPQLLGGENKFLKSIALSQVEKRNYEGYVQANAQMQYLAQWNNKMPFEKAQSYTAFFISNPSLALKKKFITNALKLEKIIEKYNDEDLKDNLKVFTLKVINEFCHSQYLNLCKGETSVLIKPNYRTTDHNSQHLLAEVSKGFINKPLKGISDEWLENVLSVVIFKGNGLLNHNTKPKNFFNVHYTKEMLKCGFNQDVFKEQLIENPYPLIKKLHSFSGMDNFSYYCKFNQFQLWDLRNDKFDIVEKHIHDNCASSLRNNIIDILKSDKCLQFSSSLNNDQNQVIKKLYLGGDLSKETVNDYLNLKSVLGLSKDFSLKEMFNLISLGINGSLEDQVIEKVKELPHTQINSLFNQLKPLKIESLVTLYEKSYNREDGSLKQFNNLVLKTIEKKIFDNIKNNLKWALSKSEDILNKMYCNEFINIHMGVTTLLGPYVFQKRLDEFVEHDKENVLQFIDRLTKGQEESRIKQGVKFKVNPLGSDVATITSKNSDVTVELLKKITLDLHMEDRLKNLKEDSFDTEQSFKL